MRSSRTVCYQKSVKHDEQVMRVPKSFEVLSAVFSDRTDVHDDHHAYQNVTSDACYLRVRDFPELETCILRYDRLHDLCRSLCCRRIGNVMSDTTRKIS
jgi:hypothetical protein